MFMSVTHFTVSLISYSLTTYILVFICVRMNSINVFYVTLVLKQGINIKTMCPNYTFEFRNTKSHLLQGAWVKIENIIENHVC